MDKTKRTSRFSRLRAVVKWGGVMLCVLFAILFVMSERWPFYASEWPRANSNIKVIDGVISIDWTVPPELHLRGYSTIEWLPGSLSPWQHLGWFYWYQNEWVEDKLYTTAFVGIPLWFLLASVLLPTVYLFWTDRKAKPGLCPSCRYNLHGLPVSTTKCPECGVEIDRVTSSKE